MAGKVNEVRREQTRQAILDAAWELCREAGLSELSLRALAERVGMRAPSLYSYFPAKDAIYDAMFAQGQRELAEAVPLPGADVSREDFRASSQAFFAFCVADPVRYQLMFQRTIPGFVPSPESYRLAVDLMGHMQEAMRRAGVADPRHVDLWTGILAGLTAQQLANEPGGDRWARLVDEAVDLFCNHVGIPGDAGVPRRSRRTR